MDRSFRFWSVEFRSQTIKFNGEYERVFHVSCADINKNDFKRNCKTNDSSYSFVDKIKLSNTTWLCVKYKDTRYNMIETPNLENELLFEKK